MKTDNTAHSKGLEQGLPSGHESINSIDNMDDVNFSDTNINHCLPPTIMSWGKRNNTQKRVNDFERTTTTTTTSF